MSNDVEVYRPAVAGTLPARVQYARELANSGLLPAAYRRNPPNILWAMEYGDMLGLSHMAAITGVHVIEGKPGASAGLISALVRRAGHRLRVQGDNKSATCRIVRSDDPDFTFEVTWWLRKADHVNDPKHKDDPDAETAGLLNKGTWKNYPASMLKSRAITQCARDACEEALFGLHYTPEELGADVDADGDVVGEIAAEPPQPNGHRPAEPEPAAADPWATPEGGDDWVAKAIEQATGLANEDAGRVLYAQAGAKFDAGEITREQRNEVCNLVIAQIEHLNSQEPAEGTIAAPDGDPWQSEIDAMSTREDAGPLLARLDQARGVTVDERRYKALRAAIRTRADGLPSAPDADIAEQGALA